MIVQQIRCWQKDMDSYNRRELNFRAIKKYKQDVEGRQNREIILYGKSYHTAHPTLL